MISEETQPKNDGLLTHDEIGVPDEVYTDFDALRDSLKGKLMRLFGIGKPPKPNEWYWERLKFPADKLPCSDKSESNQNPSDPSPH